MGVIPLGLTTRTYDFLAVADQFKLSWRHPKVCPEVKAVYKVIGSKSSIQVYEKYRCVLELLGTSGRKLTYNTIQGTPSRCNAVSNLEGRPLVMNVDDGMGRYENVL